MTEYDGTLVLTAADIDDCAPLPAVIDAVEAAFAAEARGDAIMPAKSYVDLPQYNGDFRSMPAYVDAGDWDAAGVKWVNVHPDNPDRGLPTVIGTYVYSDPETAVPLAFMDATDLTGLRTGAAAAVATDHLAREDASSLGIVGAGAQAHTQLDAIASVRPIERVVIADRNQAKQEAFAETYGHRFEVSPGSIADAAACDVLSTVTPSETPIVERGWVGDGTHINAIGADATGKQELDEAILHDARVIVDDREQATHSGEINVPYAGGRFADDDIHGTLGEVVIGALPGRAAANDITVFDSTGLAIQDVAAAHVAYETARENGIGTVLDLLGHGTDPA
jgi:alanine dehydrogenase